MDQPQNSQLLSELFDGQPQIVMWFKPLWSPGKQRINDFELSYHNKAARAFLHLQNNNRPQTLFSDLAIELKQDYLSHMVKVYLTGTPSESEVYHAAYDKCVKVLRSKVRDGVLVVVQDRTEEYKMQQELQQRKAFTESILNASINGVFSFEALLDDAGVLTDLRYTYVNGRGEQLFRRTEKELVGQTLLRLFPEAAENGLFTLCRRVWETKRPRRTEILYNSDALHGWHLVAASPLDGTGIMMTCVDITLQKEAALEIERQRTVLDNILKHSPTGISVMQVIRNGEGNIIDARTVLTNSAAARFLGISAREIKSKVFSEKHSAIYNSPLFRTALTTLQSGTTFHTQYYYGPAGRWLEVSAAMMDPNHLVFVYMDITETKETQLQLEKSLEELRRSNVSLEDFAHAASHDLKEPIRKIQTFAERLKSSLSTHMNEREAHIFERLENATQRMRLLVDDLLEYSHASHRPRQKESVDLNKKLATVLTDLEVEIEEKAAHITIDPLPVVKGFRRQLQQLFQNLVSNALKYSRPGVPPEIAVTARIVTGNEAPVQILSQDSNRLFHLIEVHDNGIGFEPQYADRIFHMFQRLHGKSEYPGTGVGLSIARKVVENHDGYIWAQSQPGRGASFYVLLPAEVNNPNGS